MDLSRINNIQKQKKMKIKMTRQVAKKKHFLFNSNTYQKPSCFVLTVNPPNTHFLRYKPKSDSKTFKTHTHTHRQGEGKLLKHRRFYYFILSLKSIRSKIKDFLKISKRIYHKGNSQSTLTRNV